MVIHPRAKYDKPMSIEIKLWAGYKSAQTDGRTDRWTLIYPQNFVHGGKIIEK